MDASCGNGTFNGRTTNITAAVSSNGMVVATFAYEAQGRRVRKIVSHGGTEAQRFDYLYDGWLLVRETATGLSTDYVWGKDISGTIGGAGGVGGLLYEERGGDIYVPFYDNNGNITRYCAAQGNVVASYTYDAFGNTIAQSGPMVDNFSHCFSTKYLDAETGLYYYGYRFYSPELMRWINRDPIEEEGGENLYAFCENSPLQKFDIFGNDTCCRNGRKKECDQEYHWEGVVTQSSISYKLGGAYMIVDLNSNRVCGQCAKFKIHAEAFLITASFGKPFSLTGSSVKFGNILPDSFRGPVVVISAGFGAMGVLEASYLQLGDAFSIDAGLVGGAEIGAGAARGWYVKFVITEEE